ncbi:unnamed protein product, partial [Polarella glacialis]
FMATGIYVGNAVKDAISAPRPDWTKGVVLLGSNKLDATSNAHEEYGLPSTHTINTACLSFYLLHYYNFYGLGDGKGVLENIARYPSFLLLFLAILAWNLFIMHGRLYLGMHSPVDIAAGLVIAVMLLLAYIPVEDFVDAWMTSTTGFVPAYQLVFSVMLCWTYPVGLQPTPSYNYAVYFTGVCLGVITGVWRCPDYHNASAAEVARAARGHPLSAGFLVFAGRRFIVGLVVILGVRAVSKELLKLIVPATLRVLQIPHSDHEKVKKGCKPIGYNVLTPIRLLNYAAMGWAVAEPAFDLFAFLGI